MKIKLIIAALCALFTVTGLHAQIKDKGFFIEMNAAYGQQYIDIDGGIAEREGYAILMPAIGYQFNSHWVAGFRMKFDTRDFNFTTYSPYVQCNFLQWKKLKVFAEGQLALSYPKDDEWNDNYTEVGVSFGASYALCKHVNFMLRYLYIGYSTDPYRDEGAYLGNGRLVLDANTRRLQLGIQIAF